MSNKTNKNYRQILNKYKQDMKLGKQTRKKKVKHKHKLIQPRYWSK